MRPAVFKFGLVVFAAGAGITIMSRQSQATHALQADARRLREEARDDVRVRAEHDRLTRLQATSDELERLRKDQAEISRLREELSALQHAASVPAAADLAATADPPVGTVPGSKQWTNAGRATPEATFESVLWSADQGDTDRLAAMIAFDPAGRALAEALFARLPEAMREKSGTPEKVFATLLAARLPQDLRAANVMAEIPQSPDAVVLQMHLQHTDGRTKDAGFYFKRAPDGWKLVVPPSIVENYQQMLANSPGAASGK